MKDHFKSKHTTERRFACSFPGCSYKTTRKGILVKHLRIHTLEKPYECEYCGKRFSQSGNLLQHRKTHLNQKDFLCPFEACEQKFTTKSNLADHIEKNTHLAQLEEPSDETLKWLNVKDIKALREKSALAKQKLEAGILSQQR